MNEYINCVRQHKMEEYRQRYRERCDVLLIDDIQFLAGKENTQQEFFHTFNSLHERKKQIVITSDKFPNQMPELQDRLKSRFQWGLIVDILVPELETRTAILQKKAEQDNITLPDDVALFLATNIKSNVRELEGALIRLAAFSSLQGQAITVEFAELILSNLLARSRGQLSIDLIQREVAAYFNIRQKDLKSQRRPRAISYPRQIAMHLCRKLTGSSLSEIGRQFGGKDHTTVLSADRKIRKLVDTDDDTRQTVEALEKQLTG
jgi:chromosomal replication initiator protein